jgi:hypothetical protein
MEQLSTGLPGSYGVETEQLTGGLGPDEAPRRPERQMSLRLLQIAIGQWSTLGSRVWARRWPREGEAGFTVLRA